MKTLVNSKLPEFSLKAFRDNDFANVSDQDLRGKWSILFFYPADFTFVCPTELSDLADRHDEFKALGVDLYGVSTDTHWVHKAWWDTSETIKKVKYHLLADPTAKLTEALGIYDESAGVAYRGTFLVDPDGVIQAVEIHNDGIGRNAEELLRKTKAAIFVREHPGQVCPAKWNSGDKTLTPGLNLVGKI